MTPERWRQAMDIFEASLLREQGERDAFIASSCGEDEELNRAVQSLLLAHRDADGFASAPVMSTAMRLAPGSSFGSYRIESLLGAGGMGEVYRATDTKLKRQVALKVLPVALSADPDRIARFQREAEILASLNHPNIAAIFGLEESDGVRAIVMELVEGPTLENRLENGLTPIDEALAMAGQIAIALQAAHLQGIIHRDLKPANVKVRPDGAVKVLDFGLAKALDPGGPLEATQHSSFTHVGAIVGSAAYMSPEQARGEAVDQRTDIWAFGCVLYEMLTGRAAFARRTPSDTITAILEREPEWSALPRSTPQPILQLLKRCLEKDSGIRLQQIKAVNDAIRQTINELRSNSAGFWNARRKIALALGVVATSFSLIALRGLLPLKSVPSSVSASASTLDPASAEPLQDFIVVADVANTTGEPVFDATLKVALAVALEQSPFLKVFSDQRVQDTLRLMKLPPDQAVTVAIAREIARREQLKALIAGSVSPLGSHYVLTIEAINANTGDVMAREQTEANSKEQVLTSLGAATSRLRAKLGESLASIQTFDVPLPRATTASLEALHAYALALTNGAEVPRLEAIPHLQRAIELDPSFAMAHAFLSEVYANTGQSALAPAFSRRAFELRDRVSEAERFFITWRYYRDTTFDWEKALAVAQSWTGAYPHEAFALNSVGVASTRLGKFEQSVIAFREAIRRDPKFVPPYSNLSASLLALDRYDEARSVLEDAANHQLVFAGARRLSYLLAFVQGDSKTMERNSDASVGVGETNAALGWRAHASAFEGQAMAAHQQFRSGIQMSLQTSFPQVASELTVEDAEIHAVFGQCAQARTELQTPIALSRDQATLRRASRVFALCDRPNEAMQLSAELTKRFPDATLINRLLLPVTAAVLALRRGEPARTIELLEAVRLYDHSPDAEFWPAYVRGQAYLQLKAGRNAAEEFQSILNHRGEAPTSILYPLAHLGLARAAVLTNETRQARKSYEDFLALWSNADSDLRPLIQARQELGRLAPARMHQR